MGNLNKVMLMGRLTRDPDVKEFAGGGKVAQMGFAVNNRRKNQETGQWEDAPVWLELKAFNHEHGRKLADLAAKHLRKGVPVFVEGHLALEQWEGRNDGKVHSRTLVYVDGIEFLGGGRKPAQPGGAQPDAEPGVAQAGEAAAAPAKPGRGRRAAKAKDPADEEHPGEEGL